MAYEPKPGSFSLFKNDKDGNDRRPDYTGDGLDPEGRPIKVSAWIKEGAKGKFMSCNVQYKTRGEAPTNQQKKATDALADIDDDLPF